MIEVCYMSLMLMGLIDVLMLPTFNWQQYAPPAQSDATYADILSGKLTIYLLNQVKCSTLAPCRGEEAGMPLTATITPPTPIAHLNWWDSLRGCQFLCRRRLFSLARRTSPPLGPVSSSQVGISESVKSVMGAPLEWCSEDRRALAFIERTLNTRDSSVCITQSSSPCLQGTKNMALIV